jgi:hypothetical protein
MNKIFIQVISDIHLEFYNSYPKIKPLAKYLFLAGDIGTISNEFDTKVKDFLSYCSENWEKIFYVVGNHEFYQKKEFAHQKISFEELELKYNKICDQFHNIHLLNDTSVQLEFGLDVYGTTLWTSNYGCPYDITDELNDYNMIAIKSKTNPKYNVLLNEEYINIKSQNQFDKLKNYLDTNKSKSIILTHFPPIRENTSNPKYLSQPDYLANYFSWNNIHTKLNTSNIVSWISGHTHWSYDINLNNIKFISNQMGYKKECLEGETKFEPSKVFEINF